MPGKEPSYEEAGQEEREAWWGDLLGRIDSCDLPKLSRNLVLLTGLLRLRSGREEAHEDLKVVMRETETYLKRIRSARNLHPSVSLLESLEKNLADFSLQAYDFRKSLQGTELREELELLSLCLMLSISSSPERRASKVRLARRLTKLARYIRSKEDRTNNLSFDTEFVCDQSGGKSKE